MLGETLKRTADDLLANEINNNNNNNNNNTCNEEEVIDLNVDINQGFNNDNNINNNETTIPTEEQHSPPTKVPKISPEYVIILDDSDDEDDNNNNSTLINNNNDNNNIKPAPIYSPFQLDPLSDEPLLSQHSNTNLNYAASNNPSSINFDPEIFDMQFTAQGGSSNSNMILQSFINKRTHIKAAKEHRKWIVFGSKIILQGVYPVISKPQRITFKRMKLMDYDNEPPGEEGEGDGDPVVFTFDEEEEEEEEEEDFADFIDDVPVENNETDEFGLWYNTWVENGEGQLHEPIQHDDVTPTQQERFLELTKKVEKKEDGAAITDEEWVEYYRLHQLHNIVKKEERKSDLQERLLGLCRTTVPSLQSQQSSSYASSSAPYSNPSPTPYPNHATSSSSSSTSSSSTTIPSFSMNKFEPIDVDAEPDFTETNATSTTTYTTTTTNTTNTTINNTNETANTTTYSTTTELVKKNVKVRKKRLINPLIAQEREKQKKLLIPEGQQGRYVPGSLAPISDDVINRFVSGVSDGSKVTDDVNGFVGHSTTQADPVPLGTLVFPNSEPPIHNGTNNNNINNNSNNNGNYNNAKPEQPPSVGDNFEGGSTTATTGTVHKQENGENIEVRPSKQQRIISKSEWGGEID